MTSVRDLKRKLANLEKARDHLRQRGGPTSAARELRKSIERTQRELKEKAKRL